MLQKNAAAESEIDTMLKPIERPKRSVEEVTLETKRVIKEIFGSDGYLAQKAAAKGLQYKPRRGQVQLAAEIFKSIALDQHCIAEGPTGTGKSLGYAAPAIYHATQNGKGPVVIVTANIALQEQLVEKDLPLLKEVLPWDFNFALVKGRNNYLCNDKLLETESDKRIGKLRFDSREDIEQFETLYTWAAGENARAEEMRKKGLHVWSGTGDKSSLDFVPADRLWRNFSVSSEDCGGTNCSEAEKCHALRAKQIATNANVIVTNYHVLFVHLKLKQMTGKDLVLPKFETVIFDEAHKAPDIAREFFGFKLGHGHILGQLKLLRKMRDIKFGKQTAEQLSVKISEASERFFEQVLRYRESRDYKIRIREPGKIDASEIVEGLNVAARCYAKFATEGASHEAEVMEAIRAIYGARADKNPPGKFRKRMAGLSKRVLEMAKNLEAAAAVRTETDEESGSEVHFAYSIEVDDFGGRKRPQIVAKPIEIAPYMRGSLFNVYPSVTVASATLSTSGSFDFICSEMGIRNAKMPMVVVGEDIDEKPIFERAEGNREHREVIAETPFDYQENCLFVVPDSMPEPRGADDQDYLDATAEHILKAIVYAKGRTLVLFTSRKSMEHTYRYVMKRGARYGANYTIYKQGDLPRTKMVEQFKADTSSVMFGLESFWAGVDVPGEALSCVVMDKIPFLTPTDPVLDAMSAGVGGSAQGMGGKNAFGAFSVPKAIIQFKQGFGRLIRSVGDKGVVVLLDPRVITKRGAYGQRFIGSIPECNKGRKMEGIALFLGTGVEPFEIL